MLLDFVNGQTSVILRVKIRNSSVTTGAGLTGLTNASTGLIISTIADSEASATAYTAAGSTIDSITTLGTYGTITAGHCQFKEVDSANHKGIYEIQIANARFAVSGAKSLLVSIAGATNAVECDVVIPLRAVNPYSATNFGLSALPTANPGAAGGVFIAGSNAATTANITGNITGNLSGSVGSVTGTVSANVTQWTGNAVATTHVNGVPIVDIGYVVGAAASVSNGTAQAGASSTITLASSEPATSGFYVGRQVTIVSGTASGQARFFTAYDGPTKVGTVHRAWDVIPDSTSQYTIDSLVESDAYQFAGQNVVLDVSNLPKVSVNAYASGQDPASYVLSTPANKLATDSTGRVVLQPIQTGVTIPTVTTANLNLSQAVPTSNIAQTVGDALNSARAQGFGKWTWGGTTLTLYAPDGTTPVRTFTLDSATAPTVRS